MANLKRFSLEGKVALVTGAAGLYGRAISEALCEAGAYTYLGSRNLPNLQLLAAELQKSGGQAEAIELDQGSETSMQQAIRKIEQQSGKLDVLVNNAVIRSALFGWEHSLAEYDASLHVNASGLFYLTHLVASLMKQQHCGSIINIGSMMGMVGVENANYAGTDYPTDHSPAYFFEKGGMVNFTRHAASILGVDNIRVNCINPGGLQTPNHQEIFVKNYSARTQLGRMARHEDIKGIIILLASDAASYITGAIIPLDGGYTAK